MKITARILPAIGYALGGAFIGAAALGLQGAFTLGALSLYGGVGAGIGALVGFLRGPGGEGYVPRGTPKNNVKLFGRDIGDPMTDVDQPYSDD